MIFDRTDVGSLPLRRLLEVDTGERRSRTSSASSSPPRVFEALLEEENESVERIASAFFIMGLGLKCTGDMGDGEEGESGVCEAEGPVGTSGDDDAVNRGGFSGMRSGATVTRALARTG